MWVVTGLPMVAARVIVFRNRHARACSLHETQRRFVEACSRSHRDRTRMSRCPNRLSIRRLSLARGRSALEPRGSLSSTPTRRPLFWVTPPSAARFLRQLPHASREVDEPRRPLRSLAPHALARRHGRAAARGRRRRQHRVPGVFVAGDLTGIPLLKFALDTGARSRRGAIAADPAAPRHARRR